MLKMNFVKNRLAAEQLAAQFPTGRTAVSTPEIQRFPSRLTAEQQEQVEAIKYFFKSWCGHAAGKP